MKAIVEECQEGVYYLRLETSKTDFNKMIKDFIMYESDEDIYKLKRKIDRVCKDRGMMD